MVAMFFLLAGALDLVFALGLYLFVSRVREKSHDSLALFVRPTPVIAGILTLIGALSTLAAVVQWVWKPL